MDRVCDHFEMPCLFLGKLLYFVSSSRRITQRTLDTSAGTANDVFSKIQDDFPRREGRCITGISPQVDSPEQKQMLDGFSPAFDRINMCPSDISGRRHTPHFASNHCIQHWTRLKEVSDSYCFASDLD